MNATVDIVWNTQRTERLRAMWDEGVSCPKIARELGAGLTRSAVLCKAIRLGLPARPKVVPRYKETPQKAAVRQARVANPKLFDKSGSHTDRVAAIEAIPVAPRPWETRQPGECAAPIDRDGRVWSCCNPTPSTGEDGRFATYCPEHHAMFHIPAKEMRLGRLAVRYG
jgi:hypothetical protein